MEAGAAIPPAKIPSRPTFTRPPFSRPPFPQNVCVRPVRVQGPLSPPGPTYQEYRPPAQNYRPPQEHRQSREQRQGRQAARPRPAQGPWPRQRPNRRGPASPPPREPRDDALFQRMVEVFGFPDNTTPGDLLNVFSKFGPVKVDKMFSGKGSLIYCDPAEAAAALKASGSVNLFGTSLDVRPYTKDTERTYNAREYKRRMAKHTVKAPPVCPTTISWDGDFQQQLESLLRAVRLAPRQLARLELLYQDLDAVLQSVWPGCRSVPFGSVPAGLGVQGSDTDCFVELPPPARAQAVPRARRALRGRPRVFASVIAIPHANTPIVKFFHLPTDTHCDVSFKTTLGVQNSRLIGFLLGADARLLPLAVAVKYWAALHELSGTGRLTNYALTMLLLFYLQQPPRALLPSVAWLQSSAADRRDVDGWNAGFMADRSRLPRVADSSSVADLLGGFFQFYAQFDFAGLAVCPYLGRPVRKDVLSDLGRLPSDLGLYGHNVSSGLAPALRADTPLVVQDPFEQCHNVASPVTARHAAVLESYFRFAADAYEREKAAGCKNFLKKILLERPPPLRARDKVEFGTRMRAFVLNNIFPENWQEQCVNTVHSIFKEVLCIKLERVQKPASEAEVPEGPERKRTKVKFTGVLTRAVWKRKKSRLFGSLKKNFYLNERSITMDILDTNFQQYNIPFQLVLSFVSRPRNLFLTVRPAGSGNMQAFKEFGRFFEDIMPNWFAVHIKSHCDKRMRDLKLPTSSEENVAVGMDEDTDSASTEDERTPVTQTDSKEDTDTRQSDSEKSPSDTDKENIQETINVPEDTRNTQTETGKSTNINDKSIKSHIASKNIPQPAARRSKGRRKKRLEPGHEP